jgi:hypothetical protein
MQLPLELFFDIFILMITSIQLNVVGFEFNAKLRQSKLSVIKGAEKVLRVFISKVIRFPGSSHIFLGL